MGTMLGDDDGANTTGMAPRAKWMACRNMAEGGRRAVPTLMESWSSSSRQLTFNGKNPIQQKAPQRDQ